MKKTVFVTGGSGYIGRNLIRGLLESGYAVRALARSDASATRVEALGASVVRGDVLDGSALRDGMEGCWGLIHAAADTNHGDGSAVQERVNVGGTRTVFRAARQAGVVRGLQLSTESVLADGRPIHLADESWPIPQKHAGSYSYTKARAEQVAMAESRGGLDVIAIRPRFVWGRDDTTALPQLIQAARNGQLRWIDGGDYLTSTTHVANVVHGAIVALESGHPKQAYFITDGEPMSFRVFVTALLDTRDVPAPTGSVPRWVVKVAVTAGSIIQSISGGRIRPPMSRQEYATLAHEVTVDDSLARRELGYEPKISVEEGMAEIRPGGGWETAVS